MERMVEINRQYEIYHLDEIISAWKLRDVIESLNEEVTFNTSFPWVSPELNLKPPELYKLMGNSPSGLMSGDQLFHTLKLTGELMPEEDIFNTEWGEDLNRISALLFK